MEYANVTRDQTHATDAHEPAGRAAETRGSREAELWWTYRRTGRTDVRNQVVELHMAWAERRTRAFARARGLDWRELWGAAATGLVEAVERFDPSCGVPFRGYAAMRITGALLDAGREALRPLGARARPHDGTDPRSGDRTRTGAGEPPPPSDRPDESPEEESSPNPPAAAERMPSRDPDPLSAAISNEIASDLFEAMPSDRVREIARRRILLGETIDEIGLAVGLGKSRVQEVIRKEVLPRARAVLARHGIGAWRRRKLRHEPPRAARTCE